MAGKGATLELAVLGLLQDSPLHGYELRKRLNLLLGWTACSPTAPCTRP